MEDGWPMYGVVKSHEHTPGNIATLVWIAITHRLHVWILKQKATECIFFTEVIFHCCGTDGPSEALLTDTAGEKVRVILDRAMDFRQTVADKLQSDPSLTTGDVTSLNLTMIKASEIGRTL
jgi:hypothetical protein